MTNWIDRKHLLTRTLALCISFFPTPLSIAQVVSPARSTQAAADQLQFYLNRPRKIDDLYGFGAFILMNEVMRETPCASALESATRGAK